jgi:alanine dehydrogenase
MATIPSSQQNFPIGKNALLTQEEKLETGKKQKKLLIGIPSDLESDEGRISLTPLAIELLTANGHEVIIQSNAGKAANFVDKDFSEAGATIARNKEEIFQSDIILKVAPLSLQEIQWLKGNQLVFSSLHITAQSEEFIREMMAKKITCLAFEYIKDENNCFPVVRSMSEIAGITSILIAAEYLSNVHNGKGEMLGGITGVNPSEVVILGAGTAGEFAARTAMGLGSLVKVFDSSPYKLRRLQNNLGQRVYTSVLQPKILRNALRTADVVIGAMRLIEKGPRYYITEEMVKNLKKGSVIIDISIDQGGCFETSEITSHSNPVFQKHGILHYCVPNIASRVARTASYALSNIFAPIMLQIGDSGGLTTLIKEKPGLRNGVYIYNGILTNHFIGNSLGIPSQDISLLLAAF